MNSLQQLRDGALRGARRLALRENLRTLPPEVYTLADTLEVLDLSGNELDDLPDDLPRLHKLKIVFASGNRFTHLPGVLGRCEALEMVGFKANQITEIAANALPPRLRWLILTDNRVEHLPAELGQRPQLQKLALAGNRLRELPETLAACARLELLRVSANQLQALPDWLLGLPRLSWLAHGGNPFSATSETEAVLSTALPAVRWARLEVQSLLGEGASGHIYRATQRDGTSVAVKVFKGQVTSDGLPSTELAACLQAGVHPQLIPTIGRLTDHPTGAGGLTMTLVDPAFRPLAEPPSLASCTRDIYDPMLRMSPTSAHSIATGMASALAHLHDRGLSHGDLYAHNILHDGLGQAQLGDFGAASFLASVPAHQQPALKALDVRALGCLLEELATCTGTPCPTLETLAQHCMRPDPAHRPTAQDVVTTLRERS